MNIDKLSRTQLYNLYDLNKEELKEIKQTFKNMGRHSITTSSEYKAKWLEVKTLNTKISKEIMKRDLESMKRS